VVKVVKVKKPVEEIEVIELPPKAYNVIRSFVESSSKEGYEWNKGYRLGGKVMFVKKGKWMLTVDEITEEELNKFSENMRVVIVNLSNVVKIEIDRDKNRYIVINGGNEFTEKDRYRVAFISSLVAYARPILLNEILEKINEYVEIGDGR
jgi:hypothetical protein